MDRRPFVTVAVGYRAAGYQSGRPDGTLRTRTGCGGRPRQGRWRWFTREMRA